MTMIAVGIMAVLFALDVLLKQSVEEQINTQEEKEILPGKLVLRKVYNKGFLLHILDDFPWLIKGVSAIVGAGILLFDIGLFAKKGHRTEKLGMALLSAGAASNIFDRLARGKVIDYIGFESKHSFLSRLTVNLADLYIVAGMVMVSGKKLFRRRKS